MHQPLSDYLFVAIGGVGKKFKQYVQFNGQIHGFHLTIGDPGYVHDEDQLRKLIKEETFKAPEPTVYKKTEEILQFAQRYNRKEEDVDPKEFPEEYAGADEYAVGVWFRWIEMTREPWEVIYTLTANEPEKRENAKQAGDR